MFADIRPRKNITAAHKQNGKKSRRNTGKHNKLPVKKTVVPDNLLKIPLSGCFCNYLILFSNNFHKKS
jgi:organic hydroperoxide reductase OsmC/OhrA